MNDAERILLQTKIRLIARGGYPDIDHEIREVVADLVSSGYMTMGCCAGHTGFGYISFPREDVTPEVERAIETIMRRHGLRDIRWRNTMPVLCAAWGRQPLYDTGERFAVFEPLVAPGQREEP